MNILSNNEKNSIIKNNNININNLNSIGNENNINSSKQEIEKKKFNIFDWIKSLLNLIGVSMPLFK
jgi:hypothetical protein